MCGCKIIIEFEEGGNILIDPRDLPADFQIAAELEAEPACLNTKAYEV